MYGGPIVQILLFSITLTNIAVAEDRNSDIERLNARILELHQ